MENIELYLKDLSSHTTDILLNWNYLTYLPSLSRFTNLKILQCSCNYLTTLPELPLTLEKLYINNNKLTILHHRFYIIYMV